MDARAERITLFMTVRNLPCATDGAHDAKTLMTVGRGDCLAKSAYLIKGFETFGYQARRVRWLYHLPDRPTEVQLLPSRQDVHTAVDVLIDGRWTLVDATHDPPLAAAGLTVAEWDGIADTVPAYEPRGPLWRQGNGPEPNADIITADATSATASSTGKRSTAGCATSVPLASMNAPGGE